MTHTTDILYPTVHDTQLTYYTVQHMTHTTDILYRTAHDTHN